jgi:hypothetical protein
MKMIKQGERGLIEGEKVLKMKDRDKNKRVGR